MWWTLSKGLTRYPIFSKTPTFQCFHIMTGYAITDKKFLYRMLLHQIYSFTLQKMVYNICAKIVHKDLYAEEVIYLVYSFTNNIFSWYGVFNLIIVLISTKVIFNHWKNIISSNLFIFLSNIINRMVNIKQYWY